MNFDQFVASAGLLPRRIIADGEIHRCGTLKHPKSTNGAYMFDGTRGFVWDWSGQASAQWWQDKNVKPWTEQEKKQWHAKRQTDHKRKADGYATAAKKAEQMLSECEIDSHAYLKSKQLPEIQGLVHPSGALIVPMRDVGTNDINGVQSIFLNSKQDGFEKRFLPGMRAKGSVYRIGRGKRIILVEGYATGLSVDAAARQMRLDVSVLCCFSAGNLIHVSQTHGHLVMADNDASRTGEQAAIDTGLPWLMPQAVGTDWNDVHASNGLMAVCVALNELVRKAA